MNSTLFFCRFVLLPLIGIAANAYSQSPQVAVQSGHSSQIFSLCYSADGQMLLSASSDNTCNLWDVSTGMSFQSFYGNGELITAAALSADGSKVAIASSGERKVNVQVWEVASGKLMASLIHAPEETEERKRLVDALDFSPDGTMLASKSENLITLWSLPTGTERRSIKVVKNALSTAKNYTNSVVKFLDGGRLIAGEESSAGLMVPNITVWNVETGERDHTIEVTGTSVATKTKQGLGNMLDKASSGNLSVGVPKPTVKKPEVNPFHWYSFSPDGSRIAYLEGGQDHLTASLWSSSGSYQGEIDLGSSMGKILDNILQKTGAGDRSRFSFPVAFSPDNAYLAIGIAAQIKVFSASTLQLTKSVSYALSARNVFDPNDSQEKLLQAKFEGYSCVAFNPEGNWLTGGGGQLTGNGAASNDLQVITTWNIQTGREIMRYSGTHGKVLTLAFSPDGRQLLAGGSHLHGWNLATGGMDHNLHSRNEVDALGMSPDGSTLLLVKGSKMTLHNAETGAATGSFSLPGNPWFQQMGISPKGDQLALAGQVVSLPSGSKATPFMKVRGGKAFQSTRFSPDGTQVMGGGETCVLADANTGMPVKMLEASGCQYIPAFNAKGEAIAAVVSSTGIMVVNVMTGAEVMRLQVPADFPLGEVGKSFALDFDAQGKFLAVSRCLYAQDIWVWNVATGQYAGPLKGHSHALSAIAFHPTQPILATASADAQVLLWSLPSCKQLASFIPVDSADFIVSTPDQYYMASKGALDKVAFRLGNRAFPFEQFDLRFNRPDLVLRHLGLAEASYLTALNKAYLKRVKKSGFAESALTGEIELPSIEITSELPVATPDRMLHLNLVASDGKSNLDRVMVWVNEVPVLGMNGQDLRANASKSWRGGVDIELSAGVNKVQVACMNVHGTESLKETFVVKYEGASPKPDLYLITIGVSQYKDSRFNLQYAAKDAQDLSALLAGHSELYGTVHTQRLEDAAATSTAVEGLKSFLSSARVDDVVIVFVAGHGLLDTEFNYFFATHDVDFSAPATRGLSYEALEKVLDGIRPRKKLLLMDTCHSGELDKDEVEAAGTVEQGDVSFRAVGEGVRKKTVGLENSFELMQLLFADLRRGTGATVISSAGGAEYALEGDVWKNGVFTYCLLSGLSEGKADLNHDSKVMLSEMEQYVRVQVSQLTQGRQTPTSRMENLSGDFRVW